MNFKQGFILVFTTALFLSACNRPTADTAETETASTQTSTLRSVKSVTATRGPLTATRNTTVTIEPLQESRVAAGTGGRVETILKREGERVSTGEVVILLDDDALQLQVQNAQLALESARINLNKAERSSTETTPQLSQQLRATQTNFDIAKRQFEEGQALFSAGGISATELSRLEAQFSQAEATLTQSQDALARSQRAGTEDLALLQVQVNQAQTQLSQARDALAEAQISAPFDGEVADVLVAEGEFIGAGSPAFRLVSTERQLGRFSVPPTDAQALIRANELYFRYGGLDYAATIIRTSNAPGNQRLIDITAEIYPSETPIPAGSVAQLSYSVPLGAGVQIPTSALGVRQGSNYVFVIEDSVTRRQDVTIVAEVSGQAVVEGIDEGAEVVAPLPADLREATEVRVVGGN